MVIWSWSYKSDHLVLSDHTKVVIWFWTSDDHTHDKSDHVVLIIKSNQRTDLDSIARHFLFWLGYLLEEKARSLTLILLTRFRLGLISDGPRTWQQRWDDAWMKLACQRIIGRHDHHLNSQSRGSISTTRPLASSSDQRFWVFLSRVTLCKSLTTTCMYIVHVILNIAQWAGRHVFHKLKVINAASYQFSSITKHNFVLQQYFPRC